MPEVNVSIQSHMWYVKEVCEYGKYVKENEIASKKQVNKLRDLQQE